MSKRRAFTLVELLVVIGIIALLISILMPVLGRAREEARRVRCMSQQRQLAMAWLMYSYDNKGKIVGANTGNYTDLGFHDWVTAGDTLNTLKKGMLWGYLKNIDVYKCPNDRINYYHTYSINSWLDGEGPAAPGETLVCKNISRIKYPTQTFVFVEEMDPRGYLMNSFMVPPYPSSSWVDIPAPMHDKVGIMAFADGHAQIFQWSDPRTWTRKTFGDATPGDADLKQFQAWIGHGPYPPGYGFGG